MSKRSRNGIRKLNRRLNRKLNRKLNQPCFRYATQMLGGARRVSAWARLCQAPTAYCRQAMRRVRENPHLFGPRADDYLRETVELSQWTRQYLTILNRVYGEPGLDIEEKVAQVWADRYPAEPKADRMFLSWFHEQYPS